MRAVQITELKGPGSVALADVPEPVSSSQVVVQVHAAGVTFPDVLLTRGEYQLRPELPFIPGSEVAGVVRSAPADAHVNPGDRVCAFLGIGGFAEVVTAHPAAVFPLSPGTSFEVGAALPMNAFTAHFTLVRRGRLSAGDTVLIHGAAGGVGTACTQLAVALGARVIAVVSSDEKAEVARAAGAHDVVLADGFLASVKERTEGRGVDIVVDPVGGDRFTDSLRSLAPEGRLLVVGFTGREIPTVRVNRLLLNNIEVVGVAWGAFALSSPEFLQQQWRDLAPLVADGQLVPPVIHTRPLDEVAEVLTSLDERRATGKTVLTLR